MERLAGFLKHGALPFTGRTAVVERVLGFWRGTFDAHELRSALLLGEAGIGKSRLLEEITPTITEAGGAVIHARLIPESPTSLLPLLAKGLMYSELARRLLKSEPEPTCAAIAGALRRMARLRPTLLVLEDLHLISGDALRELALLLEAIADETLSLLCLARPVELPARAVIHRTMVEEIELTGLSEAEIGELWRDLFDTPPEAGLAVRLRDATGGNPLALRSALRSALASKAIVVDRRLGRPHAGIDAATLDRTLRTSVNLLAEGMAAHLKSEERTAAATLASLGEVFAPETASTLAPEAAAMIGVLTSKGIIAPARASSPLNGTASDLPLAFTHTLLHQDLTTTTGAPVGLIAVIAADLPVYSTVPFRVIVRSGLPESLDLETAIRFVRRSIGISFRLDTGPDWKLAAEILRAGWRIFRSIRDSIDDGQADRLEADLLHRTLTSQRTPEDDEAHAHLLGRLLALTERYDSGPMLACRIRALHHLHVASARSDYAACLDVWHRVEKLLELAPELADGEDYLNYLGEVANAANRVPDPAMLRRVEARLTRLLASPRLTPALRAQARHMVAPALLLLFDNEQELRERLALLSDFPERIDTRNAALEINRITLLETTGRMEEALEAAVHATFRFRELGLPRNAAHAELVALCARASLGTDPETVRREALRLGSTPGYPSSPTFRRNIGIYLTEIGLLRGDLAWTQALDAELDGTALEFWPEGRFLAMLAERGAAAAVDALPDDEEPQHLLRSLGALLIDGRDDRASSEILGIILARPLLRLDDLLLLHATLALLEAAAAPSLRDRMRPQLRSAVSGALAWTAGRKLYPLTTSLLERGLRHLPRREAREWKAEIRTHAAGGSPRAETDAPMRITMLGSIRFSDETGELQPLRGLRLRAMLGLLVAARMLRKPLTAAEFSVIAAGADAADIELARKTAVMAAGRLREVIGIEAVVTGEPMYALDVEHVSVDLLEAHRLIREARDALRRRALMRAYPALREALRITRGEVPFPGLYDDFFEALRNDFEHALRSTVLDVARALLIESDPSSAGELLALAHEGMPDDEEITEILRRTLAADGRGAEAEQLRLRAVELVDAMEQH